MNYSSDGVGFSGPAKAPGFRPPEPSSLAEQIRRLELHAKEWESNFFAEHRRVLELQDELAQARATIEAIRAVLQIKAAQ